MSVRRSAAGGSTRVPTPGAVESKARLLSVPPGLPRESQGSNPPGDDEASSTP